MKLRRVGAKVSAPLNMTSGSIEHVVRMVLRSESSGSLSRTSKREPLGNWDQSKVTSSSADCIKMRSDLILASM